MKDTEISVNTSPPLSDLSGITGENIKAAFDRKPNKRNASSRLMLLLFLLVAPACALRTRRNKTNISFPVYEKFSQEKKTKSILKKIFN